MIGPLLHGQPMSVCEVLAKLPALRGKQIKVRGIWLNGDAIQVGPARGQDAAGYYEQRHWTANNHPGMSVVVTMLGILKVPEGVEAANPFGIGLPRPFSKLAAQLGFVDVTHFKAVRLPEDEVPWRRDSHPRT